MKTVSVKCNVNYSQASHTVNFMTKQLIILLITLWLSNGGESLQKDVSQPKTNQMIRMNQGVSEALDLSNEMMGPFPLDLEQ